MFKEILLVGTGGFFGAIARFAVGRLIISSTFPYSTLVVNVLGCFVISFFFEYFKSHQLFSTLTLVVVVGFLGAFTTFSTFSYETMQILKNDEVLKASINVFSNILICFGAIIAGHVSAHLI